MEGSALRVDLSPADVVTMWFLTNSNERLRPNLEKQLKIGARVVSNEFPIRGWKPAEVVHDQETARWTTPSTSTKSAASGRSGPI